jgi:hypothetical protein
MLKARVKRSCEPAEAGAGKVFDDLAAYGFRILVLTCLLVVFVLLVWAHWVV